MNDRAGVRRGARRAVGVAAPLQSVCDRLPVGFALFDARLRLAASNARFAALRGYPRKLVKVGTPLESLVRFDAERGEYGAGAPEALVRDQLGALKRRRRIEREQAMPGGRTLRIVSERVPEGGRLVTCEDVTEAHRAAVRLRESDERHDFAMRAINEGTYDWDVAKGVVYYSERVYQMLGLSRADFHTAQGWIERIHPDDRPRYLAATRAHFKGETARFECDYRYRARDGSWRWARQHGLALRDADGRALRLIGSTGDITELKERERQLEEHAAEQVAVRGLLEAISRSAFDLDAVLRTLIETATRLCHADKGFIFRREEDMYRLAVDYGGVAQAFRDFVAQHQIRAGRDTLVGRTALTKAVVHIEDVLADPDYRWPQSQRLGGQRTMLGVPIARDDVVIGVVALWKERVEPFTPTQIQLAASFASQAVIAIENVRLFDELGTRNRDLTESLEQQTATAEILRVISSSPTDLAPVFDAILESSLRLCEGNVAAVWQFDGTHLRFAKGKGGSTEGVAYLQQHPLPLGTYNPTPQAGLERRPVHVLDVFADARYRPLIAPDTYGTVPNAGTVLAVPLLRGAELLGVITIWRHHKRLFTDRQIAMVTTFADQAVIAIENVRLFNETKEALEKQTAISEILRVISASPTDVQPVFDAIVRSAVRLCGSKDGAVFRYDGERLDYAAGVDQAPEWVEAVRSRYPMRPEESTIAGRAILRQSLVTIDDVLADPDYDHERAVKGGWRRMLAVPLLREGAPLGVIVVSWSQPGTTPKAQEDLLRTFADQAVIAIENVRLFNETKEALDHQRASAEVLQVISSSVADTKPVFDKILESCERLFEGRNVGITLVGDDGAIQLGPYRGPARQELENMYPLPLSGASGSGSAILGRRVMHYPDVESGAEVPEPVRRGGRMIGSKSIIFAPMVWEGRGIGTIFVGRDVAGDFSEKEVGLLKTFADQAVIAIQNARLFNELDARNRELTEALEQQTATAEILRVISSSPTNLAPVFDAVATSAARLCDAPDVVIVRVEGDAMRFGASVGPFGQTFGPDLVVPITRGSVAGRAVLERRTIQVADLAAEPEDEYPDGKALQRRYGHRTMVATPLILGDSAPLGAIAMLRRDVRPFSDKQLALLRTFADQAVIAIQNARLFHEIQDKSHQLEIANQHKSAFLANMSHELRTPLNAVIGFSEMLAARYFGDLTEKQAEYVNDIHGSGKHLLSLINDILDLSKIEAGRMELEASEFDLRGALENAITLVRERAQRGGVALGLETDPALGAISGDERKLKQVVLNLLSNAVKFTPRGGAVSVAAKRVDGHVELAVTDTGAGIAPEDQEAIFEAFRQVGTDATRKREGTGLGLALTRRFVELHGGTIAVRSALGKGSTFTVRLPIRHGE